MPVGHPYVSVWCIVGLFLCADGNGLCELVIYTVFEALEHTAGVIGRFAQGVENAVTHLQRSLKSGLLTAVLAVGEILSKLVPLAADAQSPALKGCGLVRIAGDITLCHGIVCLLYC